MCAAVGEVGEWPDEASTEGVNTTDLIWHRNGWEHPVSCPPPFVV